MPTFPFSFIQLLKLSENVAFYYSDEGKMVHISKAIARECFLCCLLIRLGHKYRTHSSLVLYLSRLETVCFFLLILCDLLSE